MNIHPFHHYPSSYIALVLWGAMGFMAQPTVASFVVHFAIAPVVLALMLWIAHMEGRTKEVLTPSPPTTDPNSGVH